MTREVFLALWRSPADFVKPSGSLRATLVADMHRREAMCLRSQHSRPRRETPIPDGAELEQGLHESADRAHEPLPSKLPKYCRAIHLAYFRGYTYKQIAALLGRPKASVAAELHAQLRRLSTQID